MPSVTGSSTKGFQYLWYIANCPQQVYLDIQQSGVFAPVKRCVFTLHYDNGANSYYQVASGTLWYSGLVLEIPGVFIGTNIVAFANWVDDGIPWGLYWPP